MKHLIKFNEHVYTKAANTTSKSWMKNFTALIKYLKNQIANRQVKDFKKDGVSFTFSILGRKYAINTTKNLVTLFITSKKEEKSVDLELKKEEISEIINLLKSPIKSERSREKGKKPYLDN